MLEKKADLSWNRSAPLPKGSYKRSSKQLERLTTRTNQSSLMSIR